ncbi:hypothetical protein NDU88_011000 [Pleurodeles waltl]|uniref:Uncharacterized protein n=1 Tax=Pleurodeles waltl TaxID=8319 RepID=A0AAV7PZG0_PLEWA|nr:hypothetical protein NDU88_011000 [Pleurodeles waltl]
MERILQEITAVSRRLEGINSNISSLTVEMKSIRVDIVGFQTRDLGLEQRIMALDDHLNTVPARDQELPCLCKGADIQASPRNILPTLTGLTFDPLPEFQRAHHLGPKRHDGTSRLHSIIACLLRHGQVRQLLLAARSHGPFRTEGYEIRITADFSKETDDHCKAFLSLRLLQLEVKYGLFDPAQMRITKDGKSRDFYEPEDLRHFLDKLLV